jgi:ComF family protein
MKLDLLRFVGPYEGALRSNLLFLKTRDHLCRRLREMITDRLSREEQLLSANLLIPVPLHPRRQKERGYNQAEVIAKLITSTFDRPLNRRSLIRVKHTDPHRAGMDSAARTKSVSNAFDVVKPEEVGGKKIMLVDDIYTTGATLNECARVLSEAGASDVYAFTVARTIT